MLLPNERFAMKRETVKPMPQMTETAAIIDHVEPAGLGVSRNMIASQEKEKIPKNLPTTRPKMTARLTPSKIVEGSMSSRKIPAFAKAKSGRIK